MRKPPARASRSIVAVQTTCTMTLMDYDICNESSLPPKSCWNNSQIVVYCVKRNSFNVYKLNGFCCVVCMRTRMDGPGMNTGWTRDGTGINQG